MADCPTGSGGILCKGKKAMDKACSCHNVATPDGHGVYATYTLCSRYEFFDPEMCFVCKENVDESVKLR